MRSCYNVSHNAKLDNEPLWNFMDALYNSGKDGASVAIVLATIESIQERRSGHHPTQRACRHVNTRLYPSPRLHHRAVSFALSIAAFCRAAGPLGLRGPLRFWESTTPLRRPFFLLHPQSLLYASCSTADLDHISKKLLHPFPVQTIYTAVTMASLPDPAQPRITAGTREGITTIPIALTFPSHQ